MPQDAVSCVEPPSQQDCVSSDEGESGCEYEAGVRLPDELLPEIIGHLKYRQSSLARLCLVNRAFCAAARPVLYSWLRLREVDRVESMLTTLAASAELCALLRHLEIRVWPLATGSGEAEMLTITVLLAATGLHTLHFTRKGALSDAILNAVATLPKLRELEINATAGRAWKPEKLLDLPQLIALSLIMPERRVVDILPALVSRQHQLRDLSILCLDSTVMSDLAFAEPIIPALQTINLRSLALTGCPKLSDAGLYALLKTVGPQLEHLALEATGATPWLWSNVSLPELRSLKITHPGTKSPHLHAFYPPLIRLTQRCPKLASFVHYMTGHQTNAAGKREWPVLDNGFVRALYIRQHGSAAPMIRFEVQGILSSLELVNYICRAMPQLQDLVVHIFEHDPDQVARSLSLLRQLRTVHLMSQREYSTDELLDIVRRCSPTLAQIGLRNRVFTVVRTPKEGQIEVSLERYSLPLWPEALLVFVASVVRADADTEYGRDDAGRER